LGGGGLPEAIVSVVEVRDYVLWAKHIHGNPRLREELLTLKAGSVVVLKDRRCRRHLGQDG